MAQQGAGSGSGQQTGSGAGAGSGQQTGAGSGAGSGQQTGSGSGAGSGQQTGSGSGAGQHSGSGSGSGQQAGSGFSQQAALRALKRLNSWASALSAETKKNPVATSVSRLIRESNFMGTPSRVETGGGNQKVWLPEISQGDWRQTAAFNSAAAHFRKPVATAVPYAWSSEAPFNIEEVGNSFATDRDSLTVGLGSLARVP